MITNFISKVLIKMAGIKVIHSIPGRLRLKITGMEKARSHFKQKQDMPSAFMLYKLKGINNFEMNPLTSKVLIEYDTEQITEKDIVQWLERLQQLIIEKIAAGEREVSQQKIDEIVTQLKNEGYELEKFEQRTTA